MNRPWVLILALLLGGCLPGTGGKRVQKLSQDSLKQNDRPSRYDNSPENQLFWFTYHREQDFTPLELESLSPFFLRGAMVEQFLGDAESFARSYCFIFHFLHSFPKKQLRMRGIPVELPSLASGQQERVFRLEPATTNENSKNCRGLINGVLSTETAYHPDQLCQGSDCKESILSSTQAQVWSMAPLKLTDINLENKGIHIRLEKISDNEGENCSDTSCKTLNFDCCKEGQCVNDGQQRPDASTQSGFAQAQAQVKERPSSYVHWPEIYHVCPQGSIPPDRPSGVDIVTFQEALDDYLCQEGDDSRCRPDRASTMERICRICAQSTPVDNCETFRYKVDRDEESNQIIDVSCDGPGAPKPEIQDRKVTLSTRSVPHRFFREKDGKAVDDITPLRIADGREEGDQKQEGLDFFYLDRQAKLGAQSGHFNMNAILGRMALTLDQARPALVVPVEFDKIYIISASSSGYYEPCPVPLCPRDQWLDILLAHPAIQGGDGLTAVGYSTRRDAFEGNQTLGNFEDTKFGRACWVPPTMIPFSHKAWGGTKVQRQNRLETQAAFYVNGYQRDWFGFNKGAVIGSFDGVVWFAIGNGRRIQARGNKLFLAINAPFGDLASPGNMEIFIHEDNDVLGETPDYDYDPTPESSNHPRFNQAASCQQYHQCEMDADCITQLGWEYTCANISGQKTLVPSFNLEAEEQANVQSIRTPNSFLVGGLHSDAGQKRCVYRGRGALCQKDFSTLDRRVKKLLTCAPNFHCAELTASRFNHELVRDPNVLSRILYGQEADVLGRPMHYLAARSSLTQAVQDNIMENFREALGLTGTPGLCLPGKDIGDADGTYLSQHQAPDPARFPRTDYINQIGSCDSSIESANNAALRAQRVWGCPLFDSEGDYIRTTDTASRNEHQEKFLTQNSCGYSSQENASLDNTFEFIEALELDEIKRELTRQTLAQHACMRRAGSPCFSNLDCTPSRLHAEAAEVLGLEYFGGTQGEKDYWREFLVCGQTQPKPFLGTREYQNYDLTENRCCRPIGEYLSIPIGRDLIGEGRVVVDEDRPLHDRFPVMGRNQRQRSSRFMAVYEEMGTLPAPYLDFQLVSNGNNNRCENLSPYRPNTRGCSNGEYRDVSVNDQWKAPDQLANRTCCGGGWVRAFADGGHDWTVSRNERNNFIVENFSCLNYRNQYLFQKPTHVSTHNYNIDVDRACREALNTGCPQVNFILSDFSEISGAPQINPITSVVANYSSLNDDLESEQELSFLGEDLLFLVDGEAGVFAPSGLRIKPTSENSNRPWLDTDRGQVTYHMPAYINLLNHTAQNNLLGISVSYTTGASERDDFTLLGHTWRPGDFIGRESGRSPALANGTRFRVRVTYRSNKNHELLLRCDPCNELDFSRAWPVLTFRPMGTGNYRENVGERTVNQRAAIQDLPFVGGGSSYGMIPGSDTYYLTKLGRLELLGIPQIHYEPIYCNSDMGQLLPGIYHFTTRAQVEHNDPTDDYQSIVDHDIQDFHAPSTTEDSLNGDLWVAGEDNPNHFVLNKDQVALDEVFSEDEFICCSPLGTTVKSPESCCTHHTRKVGQGEECALPPRIDLMVYFNRFVSGEGRFNPDDPEQEPDGLTDDDFNSKTGEPKLNEETYNKIRALGQKYCDNQEAEKIRTGAAIGSYLVEPLPSDRVLIGNANIGINDPPLRRYGIVDSLADFSIDREKGYTPFVDGFRWNHHLYCKISTSP